MGRIRSRRAASAMISVCGLHKVYPLRRSLRALLRAPLRRSHGVSALRGVDLEVPEGEVFGLLGANGAGKTTLLKVLANLVLPTSGSVRIDGFDVGVDPLEVRRRVGYVPSDERSFFWRLTARQNLRFFGALYEIPPRETERRIAKYLDMFDIARHADVPFAVLSSGRKKVFTLLRGLIPEPRVLLLDETTNSLDPTTSETVMEHVRHLSHEDGRAVIWATHRLEEVRGICDRVMLIDEGQQRFCGSIAEFRAAASKSEGGSDAGGQSLAKAFQELLKT